MYFYAPDFIKLHCFFIKEISRNTRITFASKRNNLDVMVECALKNFSI